jgi:hypothetical protein
MPWGFAFLGRVLEQLDKAIQPDRLGDHCVDAARHGAVDITGGVSPKWLLYQ